MCGRNPTQKYRLLWWGKETELHPNCNLIPYYYKKRLKSNKKSITKCYYSKTDIEYYNTMIVKKRKEKKKKKDAKLCCKRHAFYPRRLMYRSNRSLNIPPHPGHTPGI